MHQFRLLWVALSTIVLVAGTRCHAAEAHIVTLGDSITKGVRGGVSAEQTFATMVETRLKSAGYAVRVTNVGIGGERTDQALKRLKSIIQLKPNLVTIMYGTNDSFVDQGKDSSRISREEYRANLLQLVAALRTERITPVLMTEPCWAAEAPPNGLGEHPNLRLEQFVEVCRDVAVKAEVPIVDNFAAWSRAREAGTNLRDWTTDGCHPNPEGHEQIATAMIPVLTAVLDEAARRITLSRDVEDRCRNILREGLASDDFWPSIHAAEGLTLGGEGEFVRKVLIPKLAAPLDDQQRCGVARELVRAGDRRKSQMMLAILAGDDDFGHVHAAESLYKIGEIGDGTAMRKAFHQTENLRLRIMAAGALGRCGHPQAIEFLREILNHDDPEVYKLGAWILGRIGGPSDIPLLKAQLPRCTDELTKAYFEHSLAALGDAGGLDALARNLTSENPAVRTYAATFAGDARAVGVADLLTNMLDDAHPDTRYRAAQSLLDLSRRPPHDRTQDISAVVYEATTAHPRYTEGSMIELADGMLLFAVTEFQGGGSDFARAQIVARSSRDGGRTWSSRRILQKNTGGMNVMSVTLRRLEATRFGDAPAERSAAGPSRIGMFYLQKNGFDDLDMFVRISTDEAQTFGPPTLVTADPGYHVVNNDRVTQLSTGRLLIPAASTPDVKKNNHFVSHCYISDDGGKTWRDGKGRVDAAQRGAMEPDVIELADGRVLMIVRTQLGYIGKSDSRDGGETWSEMESLGIRAPEAPSTLRRIPATGDLILIYNDTYSPKTGVGRKRTPLSVALSTDEGVTWKSVGHLETDSEKTFAYTSLIFAGERALMSYWESETGGRYSCRFRSIPVSWFYR